MQTHDNVCLTFEKCPSVDRTQLLIDNVDELGKWLEKDSSTDQELAHWIPKYILVRGDKPFEEMGAMTPRMKSLAQRQDKIGRLHLRTLL